ncbi:Pr6Pr family membrane protein [soil metagenome]
MRVLFIVLRILMAAAIIAAIVAQLISSVAFAKNLNDGADVTGAVLINFLSYFTIDSNSLSAIVLLIGAGLLVTGRMPEPRWFAVARASVVTYMVVTGVVYNLLLRGLLVQGATVPWSNEVLHLIAPIYLVVDWLFAPGRTRMPAKDTWFVIGFPIVWVVYTLLRGPIATDPYLHTNYWYPYPFLNPETADEGYFTVAFYVIMIAALVCATAAGVLWVSRRRAQKALVS